MRFFLSFWVKKGKCHLSLKKKAILLAINGAQAFIYAKNMQIRTILSIKVLSLHLIMDIKKIANNIWKVALSLILGGAILYWMYRGFDFKQVEDVLLHKMSCVFCPFHIHLLLKRLTDLWCKNTTIPRNFQGFREKYLKRMRRKKNRRLPETRAAYWILLFRWWNKGLFILWCPNDLQM